MVAPSTGSVVLVPFPFSDLSQAKPRPAVVLASGDRNDWVLCQVTSKPYGDRRALELCDSDFAAGGLRISSFVRPPGTAIQRIGREGEPPSNAPGRQIDYTLRLIMSAYIES